MGAFLAIAISVWSCILFALGATWHSLYGGHADARYLNPQLHEGRWERVGLDSKNVSWRMVAPVVVEGEHRHRAVHCTITPGMAHVDKCFCGETRYGVYGEWS